MRTNRTLFVSVGLAVIAVVAFVLFIPGGRQAPTEMTFASLGKSLGNAPYHIAKHFRWFDDDPAFKDTKIIYSEFNDRPTTSQALDKHELHVFLSAEVPAILNRAQGNDIRVVDVSSRVTLNFLVRTDSQINSPTDLKGKRVALQKGTSSHFGFLDFLSRSGLTEGDLDVQWMTPAEGRTAFEEGRVDAWVIWSPFVDQQIVAGRGRFLSGTEYPITNTVTLPKWLIDEHPEMSRAVVQAIERAKAWIPANRDEADQILARELNLDLPVVKEALTRFNYTVTLDGSLDEFQAKSAFLSRVEQTRLGRAVDIRSELIHSLR